MDFFIVGVNNNNKHLLKELPANVIAVPEVFVPSFSDKRPYQIWKGSRYSAKSWTKAIQLLYKASSAEYFRCIYARNTQKAARDSQFQLFLDLLHRYPLLGKRFKVNHSKMRLTHIKTGHYLQGGSFEDPKSLMSVPEVTDFWAEEPISRTGSIERKAFQDIAGTLRNAYGIVPQFHFTFNPIGKSNFIYEDFFDKEKSIYDETDTNVLAANYDHNPFCPQDRIDFLDKMKLNDYPRYLVDGRGLWGEPTNDKPFLSNYNKKIHYTDHEFALGKYDTYLVFDFNHTPTVATLYQVIPKYAVVAVREYVQNGGTRRLCQLINEDDELMSIDKLYWTISGDSSGSSYTATGGDSNDYDIIREVLKVRLNQIDGVYKRNKALVYSRRLCNEFLYKVPFLIDKRCVLLQRDLEIAREDKHGKLFKSRKDGYGMDLMDSFRYFVDLICKNGLDDINYLATKLRS